jgi:hypothetical protein
MDDNTDSGLAVGGVAVMMLSMLCCVSFVLQDMCCKKIKPKTETLLNDGESLLSEVTVE